MRILLVVLALVALVFVCATTADAQRYPQRYPQDYVAPFTPYWASPQLHVQPRGGPPGSEVRIAGSRFHRGVQAFYGDRPMRIVALGNREIIAIVPGGARGEDYIYVVDNTGRARTRIPFAVSQRSGRYPRAPSTRYPPPYPSDSQYPSAPPPYRYDR